MRQPQCSLAAADVQRLVTDLLTPILGTWHDARRCTTATVIAVLSDLLLRIHTHPNPRALKPQIKSVRPGPVRDLDQHAIPP